MTQENKSITSQCIGLIMDGNRRWARQQGLPSLEGHRKGYERFKEVMSWIKEAGIQHVVVYALSTENLTRTEEELSYLFGLLRDALERELEELAGESVKILFVGDRSRVPDDLKQLMDKTENQTKAYHPHTLVLGVAYGGRAEILDAVNALCKTKESAPVTEESFAKKLWTAGVPDPDLIIRTGGQKRLSNFLPWQSVYSELFFTDTLWPDFSKEEFDAILKEYTARERRYGK